MMKNRIYAHGEALSAIETFRVAAEECKHLPHELIDLDWTAAGTGKQGNETGISVTILICITDLY